MENNNLISNKDIKDSILDELKKTGKENFVARPWNRFQPSTTDWWIIPSKERPSHKYGKLIISRFKNKHRIGLHIEKGISLEAAGGLELSTDEREKSIINNDWAWFSLIDDMKKDKLKKVLGRIKSDIDDDLKVIVHLYPYSRSKSDAEQDTIVTYLFKDYDLSRDDYLSFIEDESKGDLYKYVGIDNFLKLVNLFDDKNLDEYWINLYILFEVKADEKLDYSDYAFEFIENYPEVFKI